MSKIVGIAVAAVTLVMALACGGSDDAATQVADATVAVPADKVTSLGLSKAVLSSGANADISGTNDFTFKSVPVGSGYTVYAGNTSLTSANTDTQALYEALISVSSDGSTSLRSASKVPDILQVNAATTVFSKMSTEDPVTYAKIKDKIVGQKFTVTNGAVSGLSILGSDNIATAVDFATGITEVLVIAKKEGVLSAADFTAQLKVLGASSGNMIAARSALTSNGGNLLQALATASSQIATLTLPTVFTKVTGFTKTALSSNVSNLTSLTNDLPKVDAMTTAALEALNASGTVSSVSVPSYFHNVASAPNFKVDTLSPVFKVMFTDSILRGEELAGNLILKVTNTASKVEKTITKTTSGINYVWYDAKTLYIVTSSDQLESGASYSYSLTSNNPSVSVGSYGSGTIETYPVTVTSTVVPVSLGVSGYTGVSVADLQFTVSSNTALDYASGEAAKALVKSFTATKISTTSSATFTYQASDLNVTLTDKKSAVVKLSATANTSALTAGTYMLTVVLDSAVIPAANYNGTTYVTIK
jgi:hypothetical protein